MTRVFWREKKGVALERHAVMAICVIWMERNKRIFEKLKGEELELLWTRFVNFTKIMSDNRDLSQKEAAFALAALMEIPSQYRATQRLHFSSYESEGGPRTRPLPPPRDVLNHDNAVKLIPIMTNVPKVEPSAPGLPVAPVESVCPICLTNPKDMAFQCGHTTCKDCGISLSSCPLCREPISTRLKLYT